MISGYDFLEKQLSRIFENYGFEILFIFLRLQWYGNVKQFVLWINQ